MTTTLFTVTNAGINIFGDGIAWFTPHEAFQKKSNPGFECKYQIQVSGTVENLTTGCQSEIYVLPVLCNVYQIIFHMASTHPHQC